MEFGWIYTPSIFVLKYRLNEWRLVVTSLVMDHYQLFMKNVIIYYLFYKQTKIGFPNLFLGLYLTFHRLIRVTFYNPDVRQRNTHSPRSLVLRLYELQWYTSWLSSLKFLRTSNLLSNYKKRNHVSLKPISRFPLFLQVSWCVFDVMILLLIERTN